MESQQTSAWLANALNVKQRDLLSPESLFKTEPKITTATDNSALSIRNTPSHVIQSKQPQSKPVELLDLQKRDYEGKQQW
jgi:hypothetical protein